MVHQHSIYVMICYYWYEGGNPFGGLVHCAVQRNHSTKVPWENINVAKFVKSTTVDCSKPAGELVKLLGKVWLLTSVGKMNILWPLINGCRKKWSELHFLWYYIPGCIKPALTSVKSMLNCDRHMSSLIVLQHANIIKYKGSIFSWQKWTSNQWSPSVLCYYGSLNYMHWRNWFVCYIYFL